MFVGGTDTTSTTVEWAMTELLRNPDVMAKCKEELKHVIGKGKNIKDHDLSRLPYLLCIVNETLRLHPPVPLLIPRNVENPVKLCGYIIPKDTQVLVNAWAIGQDPTIWEDSKEFKPERFLTRQIDVRGQDFELIPFGAGRRICPGFPLALRTIPIILGSLVNNFDWNLDVILQPKELDMTERFGISLHKANPLSLIPMPLN
ncbi:putative geraniol 8-hydroxylase [Helianthus anomalus]